MVSQHVTAPGIYSRRCAERRILLWLSKNSGTSIRPLLQEIPLDIGSKVNPQHLNKPAFLLSGRPLVDDAMRAQLDGVLGGIHHLHSLGLVYNDITPANIMVEEDGTWVIIDFDSCWHVGEVLREHGGQENV